MRRVLPLPIFALVAVVTAACAQPAPAPPPAADLAAEEQAIRSADAAWLAAAQAKDVATEGSMLAPWGIVIRQNQPAMDAAAFLAYATKDYAENPNAKVNWTTDSIRVADSGDWAVQTGQYSVSGLGPAGDGSDSGRFVTIWTKSAGAWKVQQDTSVSTSPAPK
jgi:ketosteroid isomerase-like protein